MAGQKPAILRCNAIHLCLAAKFVVGLTENGLVKDVSDTLFLWLQAAHILVAGPQRHLVFDFEPRHHHIDARLVQLGETYTPPDNVKVSRMLHVVLVVGIVYNALNITFVIPDRVRVLKNVFHVSITPKNTKNCVFLTVNKSISSIRQLLLNSYSTLTHLYLYYFLSKI